MGAPPEEEEEGAGGGVTLGAGGLGLLAPAPGIGLELPESELSVDTERESVEETRDSGTEEEAAPLPPRRGWTATGGGAAGASGAES